MRFNRTITHSPQVLPARNPRTDQPGTIHKIKGDHEKYFQHLEQCSSCKGMSIYEYLAIPTFIRQGKSINSGY